MRTRCHERLRVHQQTTKKPDGPKAAFGLNSPLYILRITSSNGISCHDASVSNVKTELQTNVLLYLERVHFSVKGFWLKKLAVGRRRDLQVINVSANATVRD
jgi:hypothetical protein